MYSCTQRINGNVKNASCSKEDYDLLFAQVMRNNHWISEPVLLDPINSRLTQAKRSKIVFGSNEILKSIHKNYRVNNWKFNIILVQLIFKIKQVSDKSKNNNFVYELTIPIFERIILSNGNLEIWGIFKLNIIRFLVQGLL
ncbi:hypothetical protein [Membranihabitans marinus]|uniref:hypothetical protein n=1 Tax=Membranihabitans marinus TaxID=1227546 RepID=UPI001F2C324B|nr:hypothetical protein [Membranihabitans marinus]